MTIAKAKTVFFICSTSKTLWRTGRRKHIKITAHLAVNVVYAFDQLREFGRMKWWTDGPGKGGRGRRLNAGEIAKWRWRIKFWKKIERGVVMR
jgi:hypothetical protein